MIRRYLLSLALLCTGSLQLYAQRDGDVATVAKRYRESLIAEETDKSKPLAQRAGEIAEKQTAEGTWPSVDYASKQRASWALQHHLGYVRTLAAEAYVSRIAGEPDRVAEAHALAGLRYWLANDFQNDNWWWNRIGVPTSIGESALLLDPSLSAKDRQQIDKVLLRSVWDKWTGQNLLWMAQVHVMRGILNGDTGYVAEAFQRMFQEIRQVPLTYPNGAPGEGILEDNSFHQHGQQLYSGGYGLDFAEDMTQMALLTVGTRFQMPSGDFAIFEGLVLDGDQWMIRGGTFDYATRGREITRKEQPFDANSKFTREIAELAAMPVPRQAELRALAERLADKPDAKPLNGDRVFWESDYSAHHRAGYSTSVRMLSTRTKNSEIVNQEGLRSFHLADGMNLLYLNGDEYRGIFPVWDWTLIPGTTAVHAVRSDGAPQTFEAKPVGEMGETAFVGGVSDGTYGAETMDLKRGPLTAKKSWFFFDGFYVCLGADIDFVPQNEPVPIATDVNQTLLRGDVYTSLDGKPLRAGGHELAGAQYVFHNGVGYVFPPETPLVLSNQVQTGHWSDIGVGSKDEVDLGVFNLWIDHGTQPHGATYAYAVFPATTLAQTAAMAKQLPYTVLANDGAVQAVYVAGLHRSEIVFRKAGTITTPEGEVSASNACILLVSTSRGIVVTGANPDQIPVKLRVTVNGQSATLNLTDGRSVSATISVAQ